MNREDFINLDYQTIDGRGIEVMFDVLIKYEDYSEDTKDENIEDDKVIEVPVIVDEDQLKYEEIKEEKELEIDQKIIEQLELTCDNNPTEETIIKNEKENTKEKRKVIKVKYFNDNKELDNVCTDLNIGIDKIFNDNKNTDFVKYKRVIIK